MKLFDFRLLATRTFGILCICLLAATAAYPLLSSKGDSCAAVKPGMIDLSACTFDKDSTYELDGKWEFYWNQLLDPANTSQADGIS